MTDTTRRRVLGVLGLGALLTVPGGTAVAQQVAESEPFHGLAVVIGDAGDLPNPDGSFFADKSIYHYLHIDPDTGAWHTIENGDKSWSQLDTLLKGFSQGNLPTADVDGRLVFDTSRGLPAWTDEDHWEWPSFVDDVLTSPVTVDNTTTETEVWGFDINAGSMIQGRVYQLDLMGTFGTANTSDQFTVAVNLGGTEIAALQNAAENASNAPWSIETTFTVRSHGQSGEIQPHSRGVFNSVTTDDHHPTTIIDTTVVESLSVTITWEAADPDNTATLGQGHFKQMA